MTVAEVQAALGLSRPTAYRLCRQVGVRVGRRLLVERSAFDALLTARGDLVAARHVRGMAERLGRAIR